MRPLTPGILIGMGVQPKVWCHKVPSSNLHVDECGVLFLKAWLGGQVANIEVVVGQGIEPPCKKRTRKRKNSEVWKLWQKLVLVEPLYLTSDLVWH